MTNPSLSEDVSGKYHNDMLGMTSDTVLRIRTLPGLMRVMLESDGWRKLVRPIDHRVFENKTITDWVLGEPWPGLHFPDWATLYAILEKNIEDGPQCVKRLQDAGAPSPKQAEQEFETAKAKANPLLNYEKSRVATGRLGGRGHKGAANNMTFGSTNRPYLARRLQRDAPETFAAFERGEYTSVRAAAKAAGLIKEKTNLEQARHWVSKLTAREWRQLQTEMNSAKGKR